MTPMQKLHAAQFLVNIRENCKISHSVIEHVIDGVEYLLESFSFIKMVNTKNFSFINPYNLYCKSYFFIGFFILFLE